MFFKNLPKGAIQAWNRLAGALKSTFSHPFYAIGLVVLLTGGSLVLMAATKAANNPAPEDKDWDDPLAREQRFMENRTSPDSEPAAAHRFRAAELVRQMMGITAGAGRLNLGNGMRPLNNINGAGGCDWNEIGPNPLQSQGQGKMAGRVTSLALDPNDKSGNTLYVGTAFGGVWKTTGALSNGTFTAVSNPQQTLAVGSIAVDPTNASNLYIGTGEPNEGADIYYGNGILKTTTGGSSWTLVSTASGPSGQVSLSGMSFSKVLVDPNKTNILLAGATAVNPKRIDGLTSLPLGLFRSTDSGASWTFVTKSTSGITINGTDFSNNACTDIVYDPSNSTYYAAFRGIGVYKSNDQGATWTQLPNPFPSGTAPDGNVMHRVSLAVNQGTLYSLITSSPFNTGGGGPSAPNVSKGDTGLAQLASGAGAWTAISIPPTGFQETLGQEWYDQYLGVPPGGGLAMGSVDIHFAPTVSGTSTQWRTISDWTSGNSVHADQHAIAFADATHWFVGSDGGVWSTSNGTATNPTWTDLNNGIAALQFYSVSPDTSASNVYFGGLQDNGTAKTSGTGTTWNQTFGGDGGGTDTNPANPAQYFSEADNTSAAFVLFSSTTSGTGSWNQLSPTFSDVTNFPAPFKVVQGNAVSIFYGTNRLWTGLTTNSGTWNPQPSNFSGNTNAPFFVPNAAGNYVYGLEAAPALNPQVVYLSTSVRFDTSGNRLTAPVFKVYRTIDLTNWNWVEITGTLPARPFPCLAADPDNPALVYAAAQGFGTGHVFVTFNGTSISPTWTDISGDLPDAPANWIIVDPRDPAHVYVSTDVGVFVTQNGGVHWDKFGNALPDVAALQVKMTAQNPRSIVAATHGRGAWTICPLAGDAPCFNPVTAWGCLSSSSLFAPCPGGSGNGQFNQPTGITAGPNSPFVYVVDEGNKRISEFNINGTFVANFAPTGSNAFQLPVRIAADGLDNLYVTDIVKNVVDVFDKNGNFQFSFDGSSSPGGTKFNNPIGITVDQQGDVFVVDTSNNRVVEFNVNVGAKTNSFVASIGSAGTGQGQFEQPTGVAVDGSGAFVYISDTTPRIQKFDAKSHNFISQWNVSPGRLANPAVNGPAAPNATDLAIGKDGNIYADVFVLTLTQNNKTQVSIQDNNIQVFDPSGNFLTQIGSTGFGFGESGGFGGPAFDNCGNIYTTDAGDNRVEVFSPCGGSCVPTTAFRTLSLTIHTNAVGGPSQGSVMTETLPPGTSFLSSSVTPASVNGNVVTWNLGNLPQGTTDITLTLSISAGTGTQILNLPVVNSTLGSVAALVDPFNVLVETPPTPTPTPTPCLARVSSPNLDLRIKRIQCNNNLVAYRVFVQDNDSVPVKLSDLMVKLWAFDTGITNWQLDNNFTGLLFGNGVNGTTVNGAIGLKALPFSPACATDPTHQANWEFDVAPTSSMTIPAGGGYWISGDFGIHPAGYNPPFNPGLSSWFSQAPGGVCGDTGSSNDPATYYDDPHYALYFQGQLIDEKGGTDPNTGTVPCTVLCPPPPAATATPTVPCTPVAGNPSPNLDLKVRMIQCNTNDQAVFRVFVRNNDPSVAVKLSDLTMKMWTYDTTATGFKLNNYFNGNINGNVFNGNGTLFQGVTSPFQLATVAMPSPCLSSPGHSANFELDITNNSSQTLPTNGGYFIDGDFGIQRSDAAAFVPGISQWYSQIPTGEGTSCSDTAGNNPAGYFDDPHYALFYQGQLVAEQGGTDANTGVVPCLCVLAPPKSGSILGQVLAGTPTASPTISPTPSTTPIPVRGLSVVTAPNVSRNGEPVRFLVNLEEPAQVRMALFTLTGEQVYTASAQAGAGENSLVWPVENQAGSAVASGLYLYEVEIDGANGVTKKTGKVAVLH